MERLRFSFCLFDWAFVIFNVVAKCVISNDRRRYRDSVEAKTM